MTLVVRDEAELVEQWLRYHYARGVDLVIATDHRSSDGTTDLLRAEERAGRLALFRRDDEVLRQASWVTDMARVAATEYGADWVIHSDADEFWWPRGGEFAELLEAIPARFGVVRGLWRNFVMRPENDEAFWKRMTHRCRPSFDLRSPYHAQVKIAHRAAPDVVVSGGNHDATGAGLALIREWLPFEVLHFPLRTRAQLEQKFLRRVTSQEGEHIVEAIARLSSGDAEADRFVRSFEFDDTAVDEGLASGSLTRDTRLRDALATIDAGCSRLPPWRPALADEVDLASDAQVVLERDSWVNLDRRAARLERSVDGLDALSVTRLGRGMRRRLGGDRARLARQSIA